MGNFDGGGGPKKIGTHRLVEGLSVTDITIEKLLMHNQISIVHLVYSTLNKNINATCKVFVS